MVNQICNPHKATIKRHLEESLAAGVTIDQIHTELLEIFSCRGKYTLPQITAVTSWLRSEVLQAKSIKDFPLNENDEKSAEDVDFNNPEKNDSRAWHISNIVNSTTAEQRSKMSFVILPGKNTYDFDAMKNIGVDCKNLITFILGKDPKSVAQYIRNCRKYEVHRRRVGKMDILLDKEQSVVQGAYLDYFAQYCFMVARETLAMPLDPNFFPIPIGINILKGREHAETKRQLIQSELKSLKSTPKGNNKDIFKKNYCEVEVDENFKLDIASARNRIVQSSLLSRVGIANTKNWLLPEKIKKFLQFNGKHKKYDDMPNIKKWMLFEDLMRKFIAICAKLDSDHDLEPLGIYLPMTSLGVNVTTALVNRPIVHSIAEPKEYKSSHNNRPFISYFGVLETRRSEYEQSVHVMDFYLDVMSNFLPILEGDGRGEISLSSMLKSEGLKSQKKVIAYNLEGKPINEISHDKLIEASFELGIYRDRARNRLAATIMKEKAHEIDGRKNFVKAILSPLPALGRNDVCRCGSGLKYKKCCGRR